MMEFKSAFNQEINDYLALREHTVSHGTYKCDCVTLHSFDDYLAANGICTRLTPEAQSLEKSVT